MVFHWCKVQTPKHWAIYLFLFLTQEKKRWGGGILYGWSNFCFPKFCDIKKIWPFFFPKFCNIKKIGHFIIPKFCDIKKIGHIFPKKIAKLIWIYIKETQHSKSFPIFGVKKVQNLLGGKTFVKRRAMLERGDILGFKLNELEFQNEIIK